MTPNREGHMASYIARRRFLATLGGAAVALPLATRAQQPGKLPTIGYLGTAAASAWAPWTAAFVQRLHALGWIDGRTVVIQYRWAEGRTERSGRAGRRIGPAQGGRHRHWWKRGARGKAGLIGGADRVRGGGRPGWHGPGCKSGATRRQRHRPVDPAERPGRKTDRAFARDRSRPASAGDHG